MTIDAALASASVEFYALAPAERSFWAMQSIAFTQWDRPGVDGAVFYRAFNLVMREWRARMAGFGGILP
jgi:hypothetical protein